MGSWQSLSSDGSGLVASEAVGQSSVVTYGLVIVLQSLVPDCSDSLPSLEIHSSFQSEASVTIQMPTL